MFQFTTLASFSLCSSLQEAWLCHLDHITIVTGRCYWVPPKPSLSRLKKLLSLKLFSQGKCSCPDQLGDLLLSFLQFSYICILGFAFWDPALDTVSSCGPVITSLDLLTFDISLFKQSRRLLAFIPSRAHSSHSAYGGLSFHKFVIFRKKLKPAEKLAVSLAVLAYSIIFHLDLHHWVLSALSCSSETS